MDQTTEEARAFGFEGTWRDFAPIAFTNLLLTIVTLGIYSFWARARERRFLWERTRFIDDRLEWTGTGLELFIGYLIALFVFVLPLGAMQFVVQALAIRGQEGLAAVLLLAVYLMVAYLIGVAVFRGLRYRLSRTFWHGIRGGSDAQGFGYGLSHLWRFLIFPGLPLLLGAFGLYLLGRAATGVQNPIAGYLMLGAALIAALALPFIQTALWNLRWKAMSFGPLAFESNAQAGPLMMRYLLYYFVPMILFIIFAVIIFMTTGEGIMAASAEDMQTYIIVAAVLFYLGFFVLLGLVALLYYAAYFRQVVGSLSLGDLDFAFTARSKDWLLLFIGNFFLVVFTLGIGIIFLGYRNWTFFVRHVRAFGTLDLDTFSQSNTRTPGQGEGLLDAFDVGAI